MRNGNNKRVGNMKINSNNVSVFKYAGIKKENNYKNSSSCQPIRQSNNQKDIFVKTSK